MERIAIIDLGSNSIRLVIIQIEDNGGYRTINEVKEMVRLSEGMGPGKILRPDAIARTTKALELFKSLCIASSVETIIAVATAAVRGAENQEDFLKLVRNNTGFDFQVLSDYEEAYLGYKGVECTVALRDGLVVDIGGASTEITLFIDHQIKKSISLPFGAVNLTELFLQKDKNEEKHIAQLERFLINQLKKVSWLKAAGLSMVGIGGTVRSLSKIHRAKTGHSLDITHNYYIKPPDIEEIYDHIKTKSVAERSRIQGVSKGRADIITAGICMLNAIVKAAGSELFIASGSGIREGLFYRYYLTQQGLEKFEDVSQESIDNLFKLHKMDQEHSNRVCRLSMSLFEQLAAIDKIPSEYRSVFRIASTLQDIGRGIDFYNKDNHGYYMLTNLRINGLNHREIVLIALIASKFSGEKLKYYYMKHSDLISKDDLKAIRKLIAVLAICVNLDFSHAGIITDMSLKNSTGKPNDIVLYTKKLGNAAIEIAEANKHQMLIKKAFGINITIV